MENVLEQIWIDEKGQIVTISSTVHDEYNNVREPRFDIYELDSLIHIKLNPESIVLYFKTMSNQKFKIAPKFDQEGISALAEYALGGQASLKVKEYYGKIIAEGESQ